MQRFHALAGPLFQFFDFAKFNRVCGASLCARRLESVFLPVVAQGALPRSSIFMIAVNDAEGTARNAVAAAVANVLLHVHRAKLGAHDGAGWTVLEAPGASTMLANVRGH